MKTFYILAAKRTAIGTFDGTLKGVSAVELGTIVAQSLLAESGIDPAAIDESSSAMCSRPVWARTSSDRSPSTPASPLRSRPSRSTRSAARHEGRSAGLPGASPP